MITEEEDTTNYIYWVTSTSGDDNLGYSSDNGTTWDFSSEAKEAFYELWYCAPLSDAMFSVYGESAAPHGVFMNQLPNLFKLASLLGIIIAAIVVFRGGNKGRDRYFNQ